MGDSRMAGFGRRFRLVTTEGCSLADIGAQGPDLVYIGINERGQRTYHDRSYKPHLLISGETRGGKGGAFQLINAHDCVNGAENYIVAPDPGEYGWLDGAAIIGDEDDAPAIIGTVYRKMNQRRRVLAKSPNPMTGTIGVANYRQLPELWRHIVLNVDEAPAVFGDEAALTYDPETLGRLRNQLASIAKRGAKVGVYVNLGSQYPTIEGTFGAGSFGGAIKSQLGARIHFDRNTESLHAVFRNGGAINRETMRFLENGPPHGRAAYSHLNGDERGQVSAVQVTWIEPENIRQFALKYPGPPPDEVVTTITPGVQ